MKAWPLPVSGLIYVGRATGRKLSGMGVKTIGDLATMDEVILIKKLG